MRSCVFLTLPQVRLEVGDAGDTIAAGVPLSPSQEGHSLVGWGYFEAGLIPPELLAGEERASWEIPFAPMLYLHPLCTVLVCQDGAVAFPLHAFSLGAREDGVQPRVLA